MTILNMTRVRRWAAPLILLAVVMLAGCGGGEGEEQAAENQKAAVGATTLTPEQTALVHKAVAVANAIENAPENMAKILADNSLTADEYQALIYRISADPVLARAYEDARNH